MKFSRKKKGPSVLTVVISLVIVVSLAVFVMLTLHDKYGMFKIRENNPPEQQTTQGTDDTPQNDNTQQENN